MTEIIQSVFNEISLERDPSIWQSYRDDKQMLEKRLKFLAEFPETQFSKVSLSLIYILHFNIILTPRILI